MIEYLSLTTNPPPLDIEIIVRSSDKTFKTAKVVVFESEYFDDIKWHIEQLPKNIDEWAFVNPEDEYEYEQKLTARCG